MRQGGLQFSGTAVTRRALLASAGGAALAAGLGIRAGAHGAISADQFLALSARLTGNADLDATVAKTLLDGFLADGKGGDLAALAAADDDVVSQTRLADSIVAAWYSGVYGVGKDRKVATFDQALVWDAMTFTKPLGYCGGDTGYWALPPDA